VKLPLKKFHHECPFRFGQLGLVVHDMSPEKKDSALDRIAAAARCPIRLRTPPRSDRNSSLALGSVRLLQRFLPPGSLDITLPSPMDSHGARHQSCLINYGVDRFCRLSRYDRVPGGRLTNYVASG
jgi:hypothetical protein